MTISWQEELRLRSEKYHRIGAWVAVILNPIWAVGDYFELPDHFIDFFIFRCAVALISLLLFFLYKPLKLGPEWLIYVPFLGIAIQNAYMYSVMPADVLQKHTFAYIALFIGAGMLVLWKPIYTISIVVLNLIANLIFFYFDSHLELGEVLINGGMLTFTVSIFTILLIHTRYNLTKKEIMSRLALEESKTKIENQKHIIEHAHEEVKASINYAERIQSALLAGDESWDRIGSDRFILFRPRDVVSGDFYWAFANKELAIWAASDCTGHGVPGAFMSMLGIGFLNEIVAEGGETNAGNILNQLRSKIIKSLEQKGDNKRKDGMDIAMCVLNRNTNVLQFSGAYNPLVIVVQNPERALSFIKDKPGLEKRYTILDMGDEGAEKRFLIEIKADKMPIGSHVHENKEFTTLEILLEEGDLIYTFSDGYQDQFGGEKGKKYMVKKLKKTLFSLQEEPLTKQHRLLSSEFEYWMDQGKTKQIDDVCLVGVKV